MQTATQDIHSVKQHDSFSFLDGLVYSMLYHAGDLCDHLVYAEGRVCEGTIL